MAATMARGRQFYEFLYSSAPVVRVCCAQQYFLSSKIYFIPQFRCFALQPLISCSTTSTSDHESSGDKKRPLWYYNSKGIRQRKIDQLIRRASDLDHTSKEFKSAPGDVKHMKKLLHTFSECDFDKKEVGSLIFSKPRIFGLEIQQVYNCVMDLQDNGYSKDLVKKMLLKQPELLLVEGKDATVENRLKMLQSLDFKPKLSYERCVYLIQKCPQLLTLSDTKEIQSKINNLRKLELNDQLIFELIMKHPHILTYSEKNVREKVNYVKEKLNGSVSLFIKFPRAFSCSLKRIKERHMYLLKEGYLRETTRLSENKLRSIVLTTDNEFIYRVTNTRMKDYRRFQEYLQKAEAEKELANDKQHTHTEKGETEDEIDEVETEEQSRISSILQDIQNYKDVEADFDDFDDDNDDHDDTVVESKVKHLKAFKRVQNSLSDEEWYNTPFPEIDRDHDFESSERPEPKTKKRTGYKPMKRKMSKKYLS